MAVGDNYNLDANGNYRYGDNDQQEKVKPKPQPAPTPPSKKTKVDNAKKWVEQYLQSPKFKERLSNTIRNEGMDPRNAANYGHLMRKQVKDGTIEYVDGFLDNTERILRGEPSITRSHYNSGTNSAYVYGPEAAGADVGGIAAHELGHTAGSAFAVPPKQAELIHSLQLPGTNRSHVGKAEEARADVYGIRYLANQLGVYDANTEDFTAAHLTALQNALKQRGIQEHHLTRMLETYGADGLIRLMNIIAKNNQNTEMPDNYA